MQWLWATIQSRALRGSTRPRGGAGYPQPIHYVCGAGAGCVSNLRVFCGYPHHQKCGLRGGCGLKVAHLRVFKIQPKPANAMHIYFNMFYFNIYYCNFWISRTILIFKYAFECDQTVHISSVFTIVICIIFRKFVLVSQALITSKDFPRINIISAHISVILSCYSKWLCNVWGKI